MSDRNRVALVTGASSGFGHEFCHLLAEDGHDLVIVARRADRLNELANTIQDKYGRNVIVLPMDLIEEGAAEKLYQSIFDRGLKITTLINNAGVGRYGKFHEMDHQASEEMIRLNVLALTMLTKLLVKDMIHSGYGQILNVASLAAFQPAGPGFAVYYASKAFVLSFTRSLRAELGGTGITVTALCPGPTLTEFGQTDQVQSTRLYKLASTTSKQVAEAGYKGLKKNKAIIVPGFLNKLLAIGGEIPPRIIALWVNKLLLK